MGGWGMSTWSRQNDQVELFLISKFIFILVDLYKLKINNYQRYIKMENRE